MSRPIKPRLKWDDPDIQITPKKDRRRVNRVTVDRIEAVQKDTIRRLRNKVRNKYKALEEVKGRNEILREKKREFNKKKVIKAVGRQKAKSGYVIKKIKREVAKKANQIVSEKFQYAALNNSKYLNGISSFPIITNWCKEQGVHFTTFSIFILINHFEWFTNADGVFFGYNKATTTRHLKKLVELQLVQFIRTGKGTYVSTELGKKTFEEFKKYHDIRMKELVTNFEKTFDPETNPLKFKKRVALIKKNGNQQKDTDGTTGS